MVLALSATAIVVVALLWEILLPRLEEARERHKARRAHEPDLTLGYVAELGRVLRAAA